MEDTSSKPFTGDENGTRPLAIIHPVHEQSELLLPFMCALSLVYAAKGELEIVDVRRKSGTYESVSIRKIFERWGILPRGSRREDVGKLDIRIKKIIKQGGSKKEVSKRMKRHFHDICVIGFNRHKGIGGLFGQDLAEYLFQYFRQTTLYIPSDAKSFVDEHSGRVTLKKILMPVSEEPSPEPSFQLLQRILQIFGGQSPQVCGLHIGEIFPYISAPSLEGLSWKEMLVQDEVHKAIISTAQQEDADLIVMSTNGRDTFSQKIVGSITEQVLRDAPCPVFAVAVA
jgi:hypothetical protein